MKLDLPLPENWEQLNDAVKKRIKTLPNLNIRVFKDLSHAVLEIAQGTAQFFSHKKSVGFIKGQTPAFDFLLPYFYKEAYQIKQTSYRDFENLKDENLKSEDLKTWVDTLNKDTNFVIFAEDHPVTGELYPFCDQLDHLLNEKRIYSIRISHARFRQEDLLVRPYSVRLCSWSDDLTIAVCGERFRSPPLVAHRQHWDQSQVLQALEKSEKENTPDEVIIKSFEKNLAAHAGIQPWFKDEMARTWDRSVIAFPEVSAEALAEVLFKKLNLQKPAAWQQIETTNMCRWGSISIYKTWWEPTPANDVLRGLLIFSTDVLRTKDFANLVLSSYEEVRTLQSWS